MEAIKLITKCQETSSQDTSLDILSNTIPSATMGNTHIVNENQTVDLSQLQSDSSFTTDGVNKISTPVINTTNATVTSKEDGKSVINIPLVVRKEDLTHGTSVELPIKVDNDQNAKFVVQINLPRCLDCKNEASCKCCKAQQSNTNFTRQNNENNNASNSALEYTTTPVISNEIDDVAFTLDPSFAN